MKLALVLAATLASTACVGVKFYKAEPDGKINLNKELGLPFHESKPYLLVTRSGAKDGGVESKIIYLPDTTVTYYAKPEPVLIGSSEFTLTLADGRLAAFNGQVDADLPGLLADLVSPVKGLAEADATSATAALTEAQTEKLRMEIAGMAATKGVSDLLGVKSLLFSQKLVEVNISLCDAEADTLPPHNPQLTPLQEAELLQAMLDLSCALELYEKSDVSSAGLLSVKTALGGLAVINAADFLQSPLAFTMTVLEKHPTAAPLRTVIAPLKDFDITPSDNATPALTKIQERVQSAYKRVTALADLIDKPTPPATKDPYELYEIVMERPSDSTMKTSLKRVSLPEPPK